MKRLPILAIALLSILSFVSRAARAADLVCDQATELPCRFGIEPLDVTPVPAGLDLQARLVRAGVPVPDGVLNVVVVRLLHGTELVCLEQHANVIVADGILNLKAGTEESECFTRAIRERAELAVQLCIDGGTTCMKPMSLGVAPYVLKASFAHTAQTAARAEAAYYANHALRMVGDRDALVRRAIGTGYFDPARPSDAQLSEVLDAAQIGVFGDGGFLSWVPTGDPEARELTVAALLPGTGVTASIDAFGLVAKETRLDGELRVGSAAKGGDVVVGLAGLGPYSPGTLIVRGDTVVAQDADVNAVTAVGSGGFDVLGSASADELTTKAHWLINSGLTVSGTSRVTATTASLGDTQTWGFTDVAAGAVVVDGPATASGGVTVGDGFELIGPSGEVVTVALVPIPGTTDYELQLDPARTTSRVSLELPVTFEKPVAFLNDTLFEDPKATDRCSEGFGLTVSATGSKACVDENECLGPLNQPPQSLCPEANRACVNRKRTTTVEPAPASDPGYTCECSVGWVANGSGTCVAEDECTTARADRRHTCGPDQVCQDRPPGQGDEARGYACVCPPGQMRSGDNCVPVDECSYAQPINLAVGKPASQSSNYEAKSGASLANDGNTSGIYPIAHTLSELAPWWQVDLGQPVAIDRVVLWRRTDCCFERLTDLDVVVSMGDPGFKEPPVASAYVQTPTTTTISVPLAGARGRYVRVQMRNTGVERTLELGEVQVFTLAPALSPSGLTATCPAQSSCVDTPSSFDCTCWSGYTKTGSGGSTVCAETNECSTGLASCPANSTCVNVAPGSAGACPTRTICKSAQLGVASSGIGYTCGCNNGYVTSADGSACVDSDECSSADCGAGGSCVNQAPGYACNCGPGYRLSGTLAYGTNGRATGLTCVPINECAESAPCGAGTVACNDTTPGYTCACANGYRSVGQPVYSGGTGPASGVQCVQINECAESPGICGAGTCTDTAGAYTCSCQAGYRSGGAYTYAANGSASGVSCQDLNECGYTDCCARFAQALRCSGSSSCDDSACTNYVGSAKCDVHIDYSWYVPCSNDRWYSATFSD